MGHTDYEMAWCGEEVAETQNPDNVQVDLDSEDGRSVSHESALDDEVFITRGILHTTSSYSLFAF